MTFEAVRYLRFGYAKEYYVEPTFHFSYVGFSWVQPYHSWLVYGAYLLVALCGLCITWGVFYRAATIIFVFSFSYVFLLDAAYYLNHHYVIVLIGCILAFSPASHLHGWEKAKGEARAGQVIPTWSLWSLRALLQIIYIFAAIAKLNRDWLLAEPIRTWLSPLADAPIIGWVFEHDATFYVIAYLGIVLDGVVAPLLLFRKTRVPALVIMAVFHLTNEAIFGIGVFPLLMLSANLLFLPPSWPRRLPRWFRDQLGFSIAAPSLPEATSALPLRTFLLLSVFFSAHLILPLRHHFYPGDVAWTEEGHRFAWRMKLRGKVGTVEWFTHDEEGRRVPVRPSDRLSKRQRVKLACHPDMLVQYAHHLADQAERETGRRPPIFAQTRCSVNAGPFGQLVDPEIDLAAQTRSLLPSPFILRRPQDEKRR